jgi:hypothetical protein
MDASKVLESPRLKVQWANRHIDKIRTISSPLTRSMFELSLAEGDWTARQIEDTPSQMHCFSGEHRTIPADAKFHVFQLAYRPKQPIPQIFSLFIGDAIHNLRAALDHLATGILREFQVSTAFQTFPFHEERENLITHPTLLAIEKALPGAKTLIVDEMQTYAAGNRNLWPITKLDNIDKHNLIIATVAAVRITNVNLRTAGIDTANMTVGFDAAQPQFVVLSEAPIAIDQNADIAATVKFGEGRFFQNQPVVPTLSQMSQFVSEALDSFQRLLVPGS